MKLTPMGVITPILAKEFNKFHNTLEPLGQAPGSSLPVYSDRFTVNLYCQTFGPSKVCALMPSLNRNCCITCFELRENTSFLIHMRKFVYSGYTVAT